MFYLKYRPKTIKELDNTRIKLLIQKLLESNEIPHALLLIGQKGTGKTSTARIIAKAVNCLNNKFSLTDSSTRRVNDNHKNTLRVNNDFEPCNTCDNCLSISHSTFTDVLELDAASNRGIEEIKNLIRETSFLPMVGRYRVFIIDEAHMITPDGFNALLKTLEEPPKTAIFILATTNPEKLPKTISSRCVRINFGKGLTNDIVSMLKRIIVHEKKSFSDPLLHLIANHADNSFRDAAKILEEIIIQNITTVDEAENFLGIRGKNNLLEIIETQDEKKIFAWINQFSESGGSFKNLIEDILDQLHLQLLLKKGVTIEDSLVKCSLTVPQVTRLMKLLMEAYQQLRYSPIESLPLEIALSEFYNHNRSD
jgi:DNA polymerase III subunit gamma/tau